MSAYYTVAVFIYSSVLVAYQSSESIDVIQIMSKSKWSALIGCEQKVARKTPSA